MDPFWLKMIWLRLEAACCGDRARRMATGGGNFPADAAMSSISTAAAAHGPLIMSADKRQNGRLPVWAVMVICLIQGALVYAFIVWRNIRHRIQVKQQLRDQKEDDAKMNA